MTTANTTEKTPSADLAGCRAEGLNPTPTKEQDMHQSTVPTRIHFDEQTVIDVDPSATPLEFVEVTFSTRSGALGQPRSTYGIALTREEARRLASALLDASAPTVETSTLEELEEHTGVARRLRAPAVTPAKAAKAMREARR